MSRFKLPERFSCETWQNNVLISLTSCIYINSGFYSLQSSQYFGLSVTPNSMMHSDEQLQSGLSPLPNSPSTATPLPTIPTPTPPTPTTTATSTCGPGHSQVHSAVLLPVSIPLLYSLMGLCVLVLLCILGLSLLVFLRTARKRSPRPVKPGPSVIPQLVGNVQQRGRDDGQGDGGENGRMYKREFVRVIFSSIWWL